MDETIKDKEYRCTTCQKEKVFSSAQSLSRHKKIHVKPTKICNICNEDINCSRKDNFTRHVARCKKK